MKKFFALLLSVVLMLSMLTPAMAAYTAITPANTTVEHSLQLTEETATGLEYDITYSYKLDPVELLSKDTDGIVNADDAVKGVPSIDDIVYTPTDDFNNANKTVKKNLVVDWTGDDPSNPDVQITQPGIYRWKVTQSVTTQAPDSPKAPSNAAETFYLYVYVTDNNGKLESVVKVSKSEAVDNSNKTTTLPETYPAKTVDLTVAKYVDGTQGSKDQYFPFTITLKAPNQVSSSTFSYTITGSFDKNVPQTAYNNATTNQSEITMTAVDKIASGTITIWLKHGQSLTINDMVYGTDYTIVEGNNAGYTVEAKAEGHDVGFSYTAADYTSADASLTDNATVTYTNTKNITVPTGIDMQTGAAFAGIILAMGLMIVMFIGKRKEQAC